MECEIFAVLPKDVNVNGYTVEHKEVKVEFNGVFHPEQTDRFSSYITERCLSQILVGRNVVHFLVDSSLEHFLSLCKEVVATSLEECSKCKVSGYYIQSEARCLISGSSQPLAHQAEWGTTPFQKQVVQEVKSVGEFEHKIASQVQENVPSSFETLCLTIGFEIIPPSGGAKITKLFPELSVVMIPSDHMYISKMITDVSKLSEQFSGKIISSSLSANSVGFYLGGNFHCSATFNIKSLVNFKSPLTLARSMKQIKSYPMVNDAYSKSLLRRLLSTDKRDEPLDASIVKTLKNDLQVLAKDNVRLIGENEELHKQIDKLGIDMNNLVGSKQVLSEEVRQKLSNEQEIYNKLTEMAVEKVKLKDMSETKRYELMNKIFSLENELLNAQIHTEEWKTKYEEASNEKTQLEALKNDLQAEYITLKTNHHSVVSKQTGLERKCEQLSLELVQLHMEHEELSKLQGKGSFLSATSLPEIKKSPSSLSRVESSTNSVVGLRAALEEQKQAANIERNKLLQEIMNLKSALSHVEEGKIKREQQKELLQRSLTLQHANETHKKKIEALENKLFVTVQSKEGTVEELDRLKASHNATSIINTKLESENVALRLKLRNAVEEYRVRLDCYIKDTEKYLNRKNPAAQLQSHLAKMVEDFKKSHAEKEAELLAEVNSAKSDWLETLEKYHKLEYEYSQVSNVKVIQTELTRLRRENKQNSDAIKDGKLLEIEKVGFYEGLFK